MSLAFIWEHLHFVHYELDHVSQAAFRLHMKWSHWLNHFDWTRVERFIAARGINMVAATSTRAKFIFDQLTWHRVVSYQLDAAKMMVNLSSQTLALASVSALALASVSALVKGLNFAPAPQVLLLRVRNRASHKNLA